MDYMDPAVCCHQKAIKLNNSLTHAWKFHDDTMMGT